MAASLIEQALAAVGPDALYATMTPAQRERLRYEWPAWARPEQLPPTGDWSTWLILVGRGGGKTRAGAEWVRGLAEADPQARIALISPTAADSRDVIVEGESGILACCPPWNRPLYEPSKRRVTWPNGAQAFCYSAEEADRLRGPQSSAALCEELATWQNAQAVFDMMQFGLRLGTRPRVMVTSTPRPIPLLRALVKAPSSVVVRGSTYDNAANLPPSFLESIRRTYEGTRLGRQEIWGEILDDCPGALFTHDVIQHRPIARSDLTRVVVGVDPALTSGDDADETGIVVAGIDADGNGYVLEDLSDRISPDAWARVVVNAYHRWYADRIVSETNAGRELIEALLRTVDKNIAYRGVHARVGKFLRAEPIGACYEQGRVFHARVFVRLEEQMTTFVPGISDKGADHFDRLDAMVHGLSELMIHDSVTLGDGPISMGTRRGYETPSADSQWGNDDDSDDSDDDTDGSIANRGQRR